MRLCCSLRLYWSSVQSKYSVACIRRLCDWRSGRVSAHEKRVPTAPKSTFCTDANKNGLTVLGIETSCDDTGAAVVNEHGEIVGEALHSQTRIHVEMGGIIPPVARDLHKQHVENIVNLALERASVSAADVDAIATTVKPGLALSLLVGLQHGQKLVKLFNKPFIPIHHMEAHALIARMTHGVEFPFLVLLVSGGHCLLAIVRSVDDFVLIGKGVDDAPGEAFDKVARCLKLRSLPQCAGLSGGRSVELIARDGNPRAYELHHVMSRVANCDFSFSGVKSWLRKEAEREEKKYGITASEVLPNVADLCASFQFMVVHHLAKRVQRALLFCELKKLLPVDRRVLVLSGGVACNEFLRAGIERMCARYNCRLVCPPARLCTDNGVMIAWNGMERLKRGIGIVDDADSVSIQARCPLGVDISDELGQCHISLPRVKLL